MAEQQDRFAVRRIIVAVDSSSQGNAAIEAAESLAARLHAELEGIFIEDINLARLAELPVGREINLSTGHSRDFTAVELTAHYRQQEGYARRALARAAGRAKVGFTFKVARGHVAAEVIAASSGGDLLILGMSSRPMDRFTGIVAREAAERALHSVLLSKPGRRVTGNALVYYDGTAGARRALGAAAAISGGNDERLTVLIGVPDLESAAALRTEVDGLLAPLNMRPKFLHSPAPTAVQLCRLAGEAGADVLVIAADDQRLAGGGREKLLETVACPVLLVR